MPLRLGAYFLAFAGTISLVQSASQSCKHMLPYKCGEPVYAEADLSDPQFITRDLDYLDTVSNFTKTMDQMELEDSDDVPLEALTELISLNNDSSDEDNLITTRGLQRRKSENYAICHDEGRLTYKCPDYPKGTLWYDNLDWRKCRNFEFKMLGKNPPAKSLTWTGTIGTRSGKATYVAEHILEKQMFQQFAKQVLEGKSPPSGKMTYCKALNTYWAPKSIGKVKALDFIGGAWPSKKKYRDEMVQISPEVNAYKARAFTKGTSIRNTESYADDPNTIHKVNAFVKVAFMAVKYMDHPDIQKIFKDQAERVGNTLEEAEVNLKGQWAKSPTPYVRLELKDLWTDWVKRYTTEVANEFDTYLERWTKFLEGQVKMSQKKTLKPGLSATEKQFVGDMRATIREVKKWRDDKTQRGEPVFKNPMG